MEFLRKLNIELPCDPATPLLGIYLDKTVNQKDTCTPMFTAALIAIAKTWKQPKCPLTVEWIKMWYINAMEYYYSAIKNKIMQFAATSMQLEIIILSEVSQKEKPYDITYVESKMWHKCTCLQNRKRLINIENRLKVAKGEREGVGRTGSLGLLNAKYYV